MINFQNSTFIKSATKKEERPNTNLPEILIVGKSNVGKSTLINSLTIKKSLAKTSSKPGHTKLLNYFNIDNKFYLVDAPGYGYANGGVDLDALFGDMMSAYFEDNNFLKAVLILIDSRRELDESDNELINYIKEIGLPFYFVVTKSDKLNQSGKSQLLKRLNMNNLKFDDVVFTSKLENKSVEKLRKLIEKIIEN